LGPGEIEAILLARAVNADWLLTDDAGARLVAAFLGLEVHGSLGVILWAAPRATSTGMTLPPSSIALPRPRSGSPARS
jgi:predicted nucleic acid-binding protein